MNMYFVHSQCGYLVLHSKGFVYVRFVVTNSLFLFSQKGSLIWGGYFVNAFSKCTFYGLQNILCRVVGCG